METDKLSANIFIIIIGISMFLYSIYEKKKLKKRDKYSGTNWANNFGLMSMGICMILCGLINILPILL